METYYLDVFEMNTHNDSKKRKLTQDELDRILELHKDWLDGHPSGVKADLSNAYLNCVDLKCSDLREANLLGATLDNVNLKGADLRGVNLIDAQLNDVDLKYSNLDSAVLVGVFLRDCDLKHTILTRANLTGADIRRVNLKYSCLINSILTNICLIDSDLSESNLTRVDLDESYLRVINLNKANLKGVNLSDTELDEVIGVGLVCPEEGSFTGFKKIFRNGKKLLCKLEIPADAKRSSATTRKCRCSKAKVLEIWDMDDKGNYTIPVNSGYSFFDRFLEYRVGEMVYPDSFDEDRWDECSNGIHFFITKQEAINY